ncbi:Por secretion system C-terminal sorting domain-containing protein [Tenacibaculum sp. 190524A02b]|uniref:Por secretion system C-terminal sorting domain-containing protein n=1 Tax=Tenacibaculum vairaonense TaxID=3137860 RepID=A0ABM9PRV3_9FLAO
MRKITLLLLLTLATISNAQNYWKKIETNSVNNKTINYERKHTPKKHHLFSLNLNEFSAYLSSKPSTSKTIVDLPNTIGKLSKFYIEETSILAPKLAKKFPTIKSYTAYGIDDPTATAKISIGIDGVHVIITSANHNSLYIDPKTKDKQYYISYNREDYNYDKSDFECKVNEAKEKIIANKSINQYNRNANDGKLRTYRIAIAATGEYSKFHISRQNIPDTASDQDKKAAVLSAMNTTMTRVNAVYERDLAVRMILVNDNDKLIFLDPETDNLSNNSAGSLINESQTVCDNLIGSNDYDIGHTFSTGGGGLAGLGVVCTEGQKARGITGRGQPINDPFDIDYVAHEIGHQFGATHTFNNSCNGNRTGSTAVEPGSGSTIMAYAGICSPNVQNNSDDHFHAVSINQMWNLTQTTATCAVQTDTNNNAPTANAGSDVSIPKSTPFVLKGQATDADGTSSLTYNWEQIDTEIAVMPPVATNTGGPLFRSLSSKTTPDRYFPAFNTILSGNTATQWEVLPSVAREMNFAFTVRDNKAGGGASARDDIRVSVIDAPAFTINNQATWAQNTSRNITWVVGQTNSSPINCQKVNIKLSTDGGTTFTMLLANTPNDGSQNITLPANIPDTENAILLIEAADNVFYNITSQFKISSTPDFAISNITGDASVCKSITNELTFEFSYTVSNGFNETVNFTVTKSPTGSTTSVIPSSLSTDGTVTLNIENIQNVADGDHIITLSAQSASISKTAEVKLNIKSTVCSSSGNLSYNTSTTFVKFNTFENKTLTKSKGYEDFKSINTTVKRGQTHQLTVNTNTDDSATTQYTTKSIAWIDWNQDCQFDTKEIYDLGTVTGSADGQTSLSPLNIMIPNDAEFGSTVLRVSTKYADDGDPGSCEQGFDGEVEDYTIIVEDETASSNNISLNEFKLYPNPTNGSFKLAFETYNPNKVTVKLLDLRGRVIDTKKFVNLIEIKPKNTSAPAIFNEKVTFENVQSGVYLIQVENNGNNAIKKLLIN